MNTLQGRLKPAGISVPCIFLGMSFVLFAFSTMVLASSTNTNRQWISIFGRAANDVANSVQQTLDGGYIVAGYTLSLETSRPNAWILKLDGGGNIIWQKVYTGGYSDSANTIKQTQDGGYIVAGYIANSYGDNNLWVFRIDGSGNIIWQKAYGVGDYFDVHSIQQTQDGGYIVAGDLNGAWILKLDESGNIVWQKTYGHTFPGTLDDRAYSIQQTQDGGYIVAGYARPPYSQYASPWVFKLDSNGNIVWQKTYTGINDHSRATSVQKAQDGGYTIAGYTDNGSSTGAALVFKLDESGNIVWQKTYGGDGNYTVNSMEDTWGDGFILAGTWTINGSDTNALVFKLDESGNIVWQKTYGWGDNYARSVQKTQDEGYIVAGHAYRANNDYQYNDDIWVLKLDENGTAGSCYLEGISTAVAGAGGMVTGSTEVTPVTPTLTVDEGNAVVINTEVSSTEVCPYIPVSINEYLPLFPGASWKYFTDRNETIERQVLKKKKAVNGVDTTVVQYVEENIKEYYTSDSNGILLHRQYQPHVYVQALGWVNIDVTFDPPAKFADAFAGNGDIFYSQGSAIIKVGGRKTNFNYGACTTFRAIKNITVPAGNFDAIRADVSITLFTPYGNFNVSSKRYLAEGIGAVKDISTDTQGITSTAELISTNSGMHDFAITGITPPKKVTLSSSIPSKTSTLKLKIQNKGPFEEIIEDATMLTNLITVTVESLGTCPAPNPILHTGKPQKPFPITVKPGKTLTVYYDVSFDCANDPAQGTPDYRFSAVVNRAALGGKPDTNPVNDTCPRDSTSTDKGCADIPTDVVMK